MKPLPLPVAASFVLVGFAACSHGPSSGSEPRTSTNTAPSTDAFCSEHGVPEAMCTKCNPKLIPVFQEKGDWCAEHGLPESVCPACHPELGGHSPAATGDGAPADGTKVRLATPETSRHAGIEIVEARADEAADELQVVGTIAYDAARRAEVNARARGVIREILFEVGQRVEANAPLIKIESAEIGAEQSRLLAANARIEVAKAAHERIKSLFDKGMAAKKDLLEAQLEIDTALSERSAAQSALGIVGVDAKDGSSFVLVAPIAGTCVRRTATIGRMVDSNEVLCEIVDTSRMWAEIDVPEDSLGRVEPKQEVVVTSDALGSREFRGRIDYVAPEIDRHTRTAKARVQLDNPDGALRANLFLRARILLGPKHARVLVPRSSVQRAKTVELVFVELAPGTYETRRVRGAPAGGDLFALESGVAAGERVVAAGSFLLKTETLKGAIGAGCCAGD